MKEISNDEFDSLITRAMDELPQEFIRGLDNVAIVMEDNPTPEQIKKMKIRDGTILLGLYEGIPLTHRGNGYSFVLPDKITLFKKSLLQVAQSEKELFYQVKQTLWHEIAHFYGLDHQQMDRLQNKKSSV